MTQVLDGASPFERPALSPQDLLSPWLAFVTQAATSSELYAVRHALDAVCCELDLLDCYQQGVTYLQFGYENLVPAALNNFKSMHQLLTRTDWHWQQTASWLHEFGRPEQQALYQPLAAHAQAQQQRLAGLAQQLGGQVARLCQEWGVTLEGD